MRLLSILRAAFALALVALFVSPADARLRDRFQARRAQQSCGASAASTQACGAAAYQPAAAVGCR